MNVRRANPQPQEYSSFKTRFPVTNFVFSLDKSQRLQLSLSLSTHSITAAAAEQHLPPTLIILVLFIRVVGLQQRNCSLLVVILLKAVNNWCESLKTECLFPLKAFPVFKTSIYVFANH